MLVGGNLPDLPSPSELWKEEKAKYRPWIILFGIALIIVVAMYLSSLIWNIIGQDASKATFVQLLVSQAAPTSAADIVRVTNESISTVDNWYLVYVLVIPGISLGLIAVAAGLYAFSTIASYRAKTFERLSQATSFIILVGGLLAMFELLSMIWRREYNSESRFSGGIYLIVARVLLVATSLSLRTTVFRIRRAFLVSRQISELKASPEYQAMQKQFNGANGSAVNNGGLGTGPLMGPFGIVNPPSSSEGIATAPLNAAPTVAPEVQALNALELEDLQQIAKRLSLSGHDSMTREQLIENIVRVTPKTSVEAQAQKNTFREQELKTMNLTQLRAVAKKLSLSGYEKMTKAELVVAIMNVSQADDLA